MGRLTEILEATAASREGGFGAFARKNPRRRDPREQGKREFKNPNRNRFDDLKDKAGEMKKKAKGYFDAGYTSKSSRSGRQQAKIQRASDAATDSIAQDTPAATEFKTRQAAERKQTAQKLDSRTMSRDEYNQERQKGRDQKRQQNQPQKLVPLHQADEAKVRQLAQRLNAAQAEQLGQLIGNLVNPPKSEGTAEQVAKRQVQR